jgi:hypothetical protein
VEITLPIILQFLQTAGILVGIIYYITIMRNQQRTRELTLESQELARKAQEQSLKAQEQALETRQAQLFMQLYNRYQEVEFWKNWWEIRSWEWDDPEDFWRKYGPENQMEYIKWFSVSTVLEGIGVLIKRGYIDPYLVDDIMSLSSIGYWERFGEVILYGRKQYNWPQLWEYCEYLHDQIKQIAEQQHPELKT